MTTPRSHEGRMLRTTCCRSARRQHDVVTSASRATSVRGVGVDAATVLVVWSASVEFLSLPAGSSETVTAVRYRASPQTDSSVSACTAIQCSPLVGSRIPPDFHTTDKDNQAIDSLPGFVPAACAWLKAVVPQKKSTEVAAKAMPTTRSCVTTQ